MIPFFPMRWIVVLRATFCLLALSACQFSQPAAQPVGVPATAGATVEATAETLQTNVEFGPGAFSLVDPTVGLQDLSSYRATLALSFDGTQDGQSSQWSRTYIMLASQEPAARQITIETAGGDPAPVFMAELNGVSYERRGENDCTASTTEAGSSLAARWEPAGFLSSLIGAEAAGGETIDGVGTDQYTFDERALGEAGFTQSTGQVWVASENKYVVRYLLTTTAGADYFGEGVEGTLTWEYDLTDINQPVLIELPAGCPGGLVNAPLMPDAQNVRQLPGVTIYSTTNTIPDVLAFYQEQLAALGWVSEEEPGLADTMASASFIQGDRQLSVIVTSLDDVVIVRLVLGTVLTPGYMP